MLIPDPTKKPIAIFFFYYNILKKQIYSTFKESKNNTD